MRIILLNRALSSICFFLSEYFIMAIEVKLGQRGNENILKLIMMMDVQSTIYCECTESL